MSEASPESPATAKSQPDKFRDLARELECDEDEAVFEEKARKVAGASRPEADPQA